MASPYFQTESPVQLLDCERAWGALSLNEKLYSYYFAKAAWEGSKVCWFQRSYESPGLFLLFQELFAKEGLEEKALQEGLTPEEWAQFKAYAAGVYSNMGNYRSFGDTKIIPELPKEKFEKVLQGVSPRIDRIWSAIGDVVYDHSDNKKQLNFPDKGGVTSYYSPSITLQEAEMVKRFLQSKNLTDVHINSRLCKVNNCYEVRIASLKEHPLAYLGEHQFEGNTIRIVNGDYSVFMRPLVSNLTEALPYVANPTQEKMLLHYIKHFTTGEINEHKDSQREWIKDLGPVVETNIGFIETYVDPLNIRAEFEGFVSIVDKEISAKFTHLVNKAEEIIPKLPWGKTFEKDSFTPPDFTSLDVVAFASAGVPIGINIPNYDDIRCNEGFKNVNLGNAYPKVTPDNLQFLTKEDMQLVLEMYESAETVAVALHELLGHGSGKLLYKNQDGSFNFETSAVNPATGEQIDSWYQHDETWSSKFADLSSAYEECRAETVAVYLSCFKEPHEIFGIQDWEKARNMIWLYMAYAGVKGLLMYSAEQQKWGQAHCWARFVILKVMLEAPNNFLTVEFTDDGLFLLHMDFSQIPTTGFQAISDFLTKLHCYKSCGDVKRGRELFMHYTQTDDTILRIRNIIIENQKPRRCNVQCNIKMQGGEPQLVKYEENFDGIIKSYLDRYEYDEEMLSLWESEFKQYI